VETTVKSSNINSQTSTQPLERDVAWRSLIPFEKIKFEDCSTVELLKVSMILITHLCREVGSGDQLFLAFNSAREGIKNLGMSEEKADNIFKTFVAIAEKSRQSNPFVSSGFYS
jgi:hypothetical protein